jgi:ribosomal protein L11 methyltransferase
MESNTKYSVWLALDQTDLTTDPEGHTLIMLEELLWTLPQTECVMGLYDGEPYFMGMQVFSSTPDIEAAIEDLIRSEGLQARIIQIQIIHEEDWAESWKQYWHVSRILPHLVIQPSWEVFEAEPKDIVLHLDPGSAFGTGTHATTQVMLYAIDYYLKHPLTASRFNSALDVGTGSGILAITAQKLGLKTVWATDNDPLALLVAQDNAQRNGVRFNHLSTQPLDTITEKFDLVIANILAHVICDMLPELKRKLSSQGRLLLSGITHQQFPMMAKALAENKLKLHRILQLGDWLGLVAVK